jgi:hypothetical protein
VACLDMALDFYFVSWFSELMIKYVSQFYVVAFLGFLMQFLNIACRNWRAWLVYLVNFKITLPYFFY